MRADIRSSTHMQEAVASNEFSYLLSNASNIPLTPVSLKKPVDTLQTLSYNNLLLVRALG